MRLTNPMRMDPSSHDIEGGVVIRLRVTSLERRTSTLMTYEILFRGMFLQEEQEEVILFTGETVDFFRDA